MNTNHFSTTILVKQSAEQVFNAINNPRAWWSEEIIGNTHKLHDEFDYHFEDIHRCRIKITELIPDKKVVWHVLDNHFKPGIFGNNLSPASDLVSGKAEWIDTDIVFEITQKDNNTQLRFTHVGLVPEYECFDVCVNGWTHYIRESLFDLITTGQGQPNSTGAPMTTDEQRFRETRNR